MVHDGQLDIARLRRGDKPAWDAFVTRFAGLIHAAVAGVLRQSGRDLAEAADLAQDVFVRLCKDDYRLLGLYDPSRAAPATWLTVVARSVALDAVRRRRPPAVTLDDAPESAVAVAAQEPTRLRIPSGLLSPRQELILTLLYDQDMDPAEVGQKLGIDPQTVRSMHHKALSRLRNHFAAEEAGRAGPTAPPGPRPGAPGAAPARPPPTAPPPRQSGGDV
ncbi:MAG: sigma-70 family RNA polymerase sigma factor [Alphaproteobacteria bacterium]|nr:sigma-70 family RNA polymerase sigma factor [Alphaproteobacteria bacterium]